MVVKSMLLDFSLDPGLLRTNNQATNLFIKVENVLKDYCSLKTMHAADLDGGFVKMYKSDMDCLVTLRIYDHGLLTITAEYNHVEGKPPFLSLDDRRKCGDDLVKRVDGLKRVLVMPDVQRGNVYKPAYYPTTDERILEYDIDKIVFEEQSPFQKVCIVHSYSLGNMLILDDLQNISEADLIYTETIMQRGKENYADKEVLILGGGDGALVYELLKENPKMITMLELDEVVIRACNQHMKSICGDVLETRSSSNYEIIIGDCMKLIDKYISENRKFDYIFGDLTDIPFSEEPTGSNWNFITTILEKSLKVMKPTGKFMTHGNGKNAHESLKMYETYLNNLTPNVKFTKCSALIPSFMEYWVFYQISFADQQNEL